MTQELKEIDVLSLAKLYGLFMAVIGLFLGILFSLFGSAMMSGNPEAGMLFEGMGVMAVVTMPVGYGIGGFISGAIFAFLYNLVAGWIGGVEIELD